ncbi:Crp/Fnr family transcriptional regulator [bacterium]|nr:Crp/Fnr family transcriptional regulator [bacterium]
MINSECAGYQNTNLNNLLRIGGNMINTEMLRLIKAFEGMNDKQFATIQKHCEELNYEKGDKLFTEGDSASHLWNVIKGQVDLRFEMPDKRKTSSDHTIASVDVGKGGAESMVLGWSCFIPPFKMRLSAYCMTNTCTIVKIPKEALLQLFAKDSLMGYKFMSYMMTVVGYRFQQFQDHVAKNMGEDLMSGW